MGLLFEEGGERRDKGMRALGLGGKGVVEVRFGGGWWFFGLGGVVIVWVWGLRWRWTWTWTWVRRGLRDGEEGEVEGGGGRWRFGSHILGVKGGVCVV